MRCMVKPQRRDDGECAHPRRARRSDAVVTIFTLVGGAACQKCPPKAPRRGGGIKYIEERELSMLVPKLE